MTRGREARSRASRCRRSPHGGARVGPSITGGMTALVVAWRGALAGVGLALTAGGVALAGPRADLAAQEAPVVHGWMGAASQAAHQYDPWPEVGRELGFGLLVANPVGEFGEHVGVGGGFHLWGVFYLGEGRRVGLRLDGTVITYGKVSEERTLPAPTLPLVVELTTENSIATFAIGPLVLLARGTVSPYVTASIGSSQFVTRTSAWAGGTAVPLASADHFERYSLMLAAGAGARVVLAERRAHPIALDLSARYVHHGRNEYLRRGDLRELPDGSLEVDPVVSGTNLVVVGLGVTVGFR